MNAGKLDKKITIMQYTQDANGDFALLPSRRIWAQIDEDAGNCIYSNYAFGIKCAKLETRITNIPCMTFISHGADTYMVTECTSDRLYNTITAARVVLTQCTAFRYETTGDEYNRQHREITRLFGFCAVMGEKYVRPIEHITHSETTKGVILTTPKAITLREGDVIRTATGDYAIKTCHTLDIDKNDYELELRKDV